MGWLVEMVALITVTGEPNERLALGTIGAVLDLSDLNAFAFQFAFATPSPGSTLTDQLPASVKLGLSFRIDAGVPSLRAQAWGEGTK